MLRGSIAYPIPTASLGRNADITHGQDGSLKSIFEPHFNGVAGLTGGNHFSLLRLIAL
jgi:hypothetical protein